METNLYIGNLSFDTSEDELKELFSQAGEVVSVKLIRDYYSGKSRGFGFIEMSNQEEMQEAIKLFNGYQLKDRELRVDVARKKEDKKSNRGGRRGGRY
ncbi:MAG TPA: RNA-binding protein [Anaerolineae bacterium]|nr:RNA-binding protein [Anaerolineae bacterium]